MTRLRAGTRGSELAVRQTELVCDTLRQHDPSVKIERIIIKTHGDADQVAPFDRNWPVGAFVNAIERALLNHEIDFAIHSYKDLPTEHTDGLTIAATPERAAVHDVLLTRGATQLSELPAGARIGTSSPRRAAQLLQLGAFEVVPIRGNVPTRVGLLESNGLDGVILAAAGLARLGIEHPHTIELPLDRFLPAAGQGALAVQARSGDAAVELLATLDHSPTHREVDAERAVLRAMNAGCHTPVAALGIDDGGLIDMRACLFNDDFSRRVEGTVSGESPEEIGAALGRQLLSALQ